MNWIQINCRAQKNPNKKKEAFQIAVFSGILVLVISALVYKKHKDKQKKSQQTIAPIDAESFNNKEFLTSLDNSINDENDENQKNNLQTL